MIALTERDTLSVNAITMNVATSGTSSQILRRTRSPEAQPSDLDYVITTQLITLTQPCCQSVSVVGQLAKTVVSPAWLGRLKRRLKELAQLPANWDSYGATPVDPRVIAIAEDFIEWFAVDDMPPPDLFATVDGGIQMEWHIRRVNVEIEISPEGTSIYFHDLNSGDPWSRPASPTDLQMVRRRLLERP